MTRAGHGAGCRRRRYVLARLLVGGALVASVFAVAPAGAQAAPDLTWTEAISPPSDGFLNPGDTFDDTITVINGPGEATNVDVIDLVVGPLIFVGSVSGCVQQDPGLVVCPTVLSMPANTSQSFRFTLQLDPAYTGDGSDLSVNANVVADTPVPTPPVPTTLPPVGPAIADLSWTKTVTPPPAGRVSPGDDFAYTVTVTNHGPSRASNVVVSDPLPNHLTFVSSSSGCTAGVTCPAIASLTPGLSKSFSFTVRLDPAYRGDGSDLSNRAVVTSSTKPVVPDPTPPPAPTPPPPLVVPEPPGPPPSTVPPPPPSTVAPPPPPSSGLKFVAVDPVRILDTRDGTGGASARQVAAGGELTFPVTGGVVPAGAKAVALNVTTTLVDGPGYATVWPAGAPMPPTSNVNVSVAGETAANAAVVPIGAAGEVSLYTFEAAHLVVDLTGYWIEPSSSTDGRFFPVPVATRVLDTRTGTGGKSTPFAAGERYDVAVTGSVVPADATAVAATVTYTRPTAAGYLTVWPAGSPQPAVSTANPNGPGDIRSNLALVKIGASGKVSVFSYQSTDVVIDVVGYVGAATSSHGLFTPVPPRRMEDSRRSGAAFGRLGAGQTATLSFDSVVPPEATTVLTNVTATDTVAGGFLTASAAGVPRPLASSVNWAGPDQSRSALTGAGLGGGRAVQYFAASETDVVVDLAGWFT
ncbi:MAG TPA: DUF11 domain-containing protein [Acidimicrobiales bacterium]|nr:DUF11 domain-containing protein [Acidimicrobiales bacterium]